MILSIEMNVLESVIVANLFACMILSIEMNVLESVIVAECCDFCPCVWIVCWLICLFKSLLLLLTFSFPFSFKKKKKLSLRGWEFVPRLLPTYYLPEKRVFLFFVFVFVFCF